MAKCLQDDVLLADAHVAAELFSDDLIAADKQLDVIGGSAGASSVSFGSIATPNPTTCSPAR